MMKMFKNLIWLFIAAIVACVSSCGRELPVGENPYVGGREPSKVKFGLLNKKLDPVMTKDTMEISIKGLMSEDTSKIKVYINESLAQLVDRTDSTMRVRIPENVSTGNMKIVIENQIFFGPTIYIKGAITVDQNFASGEGFNSVVNGIHKFGANFYVTGSFTSYNNEAVWDKAWQHRLHILNDRGQTVKSEFGQGANGTVNMIRHMKNEKFLIAGNFSNFNGKDAGNITILQSSGEIDLEEVDVINLDLRDPSKNTDKVSTFNGLLNGTVQNIFLSEDEKSVIAVGDFDKYEKFDYKNSTKFNKNRIATKVKHVARLFLDGRLDSTFQISNEGFNGAVRTAIQLPNRKILIGGYFTTYNLKPANNIIVLNEDGTVDDKFLGTGVKNGGIHCITYNAKLKKIGIVGTFNEFNGTQVRGAIILNEDGTKDSQFEFRDANNRAPNFIYIMDDGHIIVNGDFEKYDNVNRSNLLILNPDGSADQNLNTNGRFRGSIYAVYETKSSEGFPALLIGGSFSSFEEIKANNIVRLEIRN